MTDKQNPMYAADQNRTRPFVTFLDNALVTSPNVFSDAQKLLLLDACRELRASTIEDCARIAERTLLSVPQTDEYTENITMTATDVARADIAKAIRALLSTEKEI